MGSRSFPIKAPTRQMLYPLSYRGIAFNGRGMLTPVVDVVNHGHSSKNMKRDRPRRAISFRKTFRKTVRLRRASLFLGFCKHASTVQRIVNDLAHGRGFRINVHSVACLKMPDDALSRYVQRHAVQLRETARLDMIDSHKPLMERQVCIKRHDCLNSSN